MRISHVFLGLFVPTFFAGVFLLEASDKPNTEVQITKIESTFVDTPKIAASGYNKRTPGRPGSWLEVEVTFDRKPEAKSPKFADELTFNYYILLKNEGVNADRKPTLLTGSVTHIHVPEDRNLHAVAYVSPRTLNRFFDGKAPGNTVQTITDVGVTITDKQGLLAIATAKGTVQGEKGWWDNSALYTPTPGCILNKTETPFASLEWDFYELVKPKSGN